MGNAVYPNYVRGLSISVYKAAEYDTIIQRSAAGYETRIAQMTNPIWHYKLIYNYLKDLVQDLPPGGAGYTDLDSLLGFFMARQGEFDDFLYDDVNDDFVGPGVDGGGAPNLAAQLPLVNDGAGNYYSPVQRLLGGAAEDITDLIPTNTTASISVYSNGLLIAPGVSTWSLGGPGLALPGSSYGGLYVKWVGVPTAPITAQFAWYHRLRFDGPQFDFESFVKNIYTIGGPDTKNGAGMVSMVTSRPAINI